MSSASNGLYSRSMNSIVELTDGITEISNGDITCDVLTCNTLQTTTFSSTTITDGFATLTSGNLTGLNNLTTINTTVNNTMTAPTANISTANITTANISTANISTANITTGNISTANISTSNITTAKITTGNISTANITTGNISTANITTANITTANISNATITNSLTAPTVSVTNGLFQNIQPITNASTSNLFTNSTSIINFGGTGAVYIGKTSAYPNTYLELSQSGYNSILDFHCSTVSNDFDARIVAIAGGTTEGQAILGFISGVFDVSANTNININTPRIDCNTTNYINMSSPTTTLKQNTMNINSTTSNIISTTALNMSAPTIKINTNTFRFVPWTVFSSATSLTGIVGGSTTAPQCSSTAVMKYIYSVIGNTMYIKFSLYQSGGTGSSAGSGTYYYNLPTGYTLKYTSLITSSTTGTNGNTGTQIGSCSFKRFTIGNGIGNVYSLNATNTIVLWNEVNSAYNIQSSTTYEYSLNNVNYTFEASFPII